MLQEVEAWTEAVIGQLTGGLSASHDQEAQGSTNLRERTRRRILAHLGKNYRKADESRSKGHEVFIPRKGLAA